MTFSVPSPSVAVIGSGPAGLWIAENLAGAGCDVTVYDRMPSVARKLLMAGRGGLNITHSEDLASLIPRYGAAADWMAPMIRAFPPQALRGWCEGLGVGTFVGSSGRVFPSGMKAAPLLRAWLRRLQTLGVRFALSHEWQGGDKRAGLVFRDKTGNLIQVKALAVALALGGASWPRLGSTGAWADLLRGQAIDVVPFRPANCGFTVPWSEVFASRFAGRPLKPVVASFAGRSLQGEAMITARGIEGGVIYALSAPLREAIAACGYADLRLDLRPGISESRLAEKLAAPRGGKSLSTWLRGAAGLSPLAVALLRESGDEMPDGVQPMAAHIKNARVRLTATAGMARAISSAGGIARHEVDDGLMLVQKPGFFAAGEMLDWEAPTGGYLLQGCFSTAHAAAQGIRRYLRGTFPVTSLPR